MSLQVDGPAAMWRRVTRSKALFLTTAAQLMCPTLAPVVEWFEEGLAIACVDDRQDPASIVASVETPSRKTWILGVLQAAGLDVLDVRLIDAHPETVRLANQLRIPIFTDEHPKSSKILQFLHLTSSAARVWLPSTFEDVSLHAAFSFLACLLEARDAERMFVADDWNFGMSPQLSRALLVAARETLGSTERAQVMLASPRLSTEELSSLRGEAVWYMSRGSGRLSRLHSLDRPFGDSN